MANLSVLNDMQKIGVALSLYNKVDELKTNVNIIRKHWSSYNEAFISVCCNDPASVATVEKLHVNAVIRGDDIPTTTKAHRRFRIFDCIRKSIGACEAEFIIHFHSDAYAIRVESILEIIEKMENTGASVAFRGRGLPFRSGKCIHGDVDDHFIIFKRQALLDRDFFNIRVDQYTDLTHLKYLSVGNPESLMAFLIINAFSESEMLFYTDMRESIVDSSVPPDPFYVDGVMHRSANPFNLDETRGFFHIGDSSRLVEFLTKYGVPPELISYQTQVEQQPSVDDYMKEWLNA